MKTINDLSIGDSEQIQKKVTERDINQFAEITGDKNPVHLDEKYAKNSIFKNKVAHGMLTASLFSNILGNKFPGNGTIYLKQSLTFCKPVYVNEMITAKIIVKDINYDKQQVLFETFCYNEKNEIVIKGEALVMPPKENIK